MSVHPRWALGVWALALALGATASSSAQQERFNSGQSVVPNFEGWERNPDGTFDMVFGYMNRNHVEQLSVPVGPDNNIQPGGPDRGQPTYFYPRLNRYIFRITVPKEWGKKTELVWTLTVHGKTEKAYAWLQPEWEIDRKVEVSNTGGGGGTSELIYKNQRPVLKVDPVQPVTLPRPLALTVSVTDDGIPVPKPRRQPAIGQESPPALQGASSSPVNVPQYQASRPPLGLSVAWFVYRGPAKVTFDPDGYQSVKDGKVVATASFAQPGTYVLRAVGYDGMLRKPEDVTVTVKAPASQP